MLKQKGSSNVFEEVILFMIGVVIFVMFFYVFNVYEGYFSSVSEDVQLSDVKNLVLMNVMKLWTTPGNSSYMIRIPQLAAGVPYKIELSSDGITVTGRKTVRSEVFNISARMSGSVWSKEGRLTIIKTEDYITII